VEISKHKNGKWTLEPFPPGHYEEYEILPDGRTKLLESCRYFKPGDKPSFHPFVPWNGEINYDRYSVTIKFLSIVNKFINQCAKISKIHEYYTIFYLLQL